jgi:hypothetical protein
VNGASAKNASGKNMAGRNIVGLNMDATRTNLSGPRLRNGLAVAAWAGITRYIRALSSAAWEEASGGSAQIGDRMSFRIADVFLPEPSEVLANLTPEVETNGVVVEFSDSGSRPPAHAVVRITGQQSVLLPVGALRVVDNG